MDGLQRTEVQAGDAELHAALLAADLPVDDLDVSEGRFFRFEKNGILAGFGGYEPFGEDALLRSVVVVPPQRGTGAGRLIAESLAEAMRGAGVRRVFLLTTTAEAFFEHLGFVRIERETAPAMILATPQATSICASAAMLGREL
jgi:N-acetylglutamate synthase-like GNAT family acetyltransferase